MATEFNNEVTQAIADNVKTSSKDAVIEFGGKKYLSFDAIFLLSSSMLYASNYAHDEKVKATTRALSDILDSLTKQ
jgi:hypothetical protein